MTPGPISRLPAALRKPVLGFAALLRGTLRRGHRPSVRECGPVAIAPFLNNCASAACVSADFELCWAFRALHEADCERQGRSDRDNVPWLVQRLDELDLPITWATVGHLFLEECGRCDGRPHPNMPRPPSELFWAGDWYKHDPCTNVETDPLWYAPDLIGLIASARAGHEIGSHSFSHIDYSPGNSTSELVWKELEESLRCMEPFGLRARSHVFPFNRMGPQHLSILGAGGVTAVRWRDPTLRLSYPVRSEGGVYRLTESLNLRRPRWCRHVDLAETLLAHADRRHAAFNVWFHPSATRDLLEHELVSLLRVLRDRRDSGRTWVTTMSALAAYCEARETTEIAVEQSLAGLAVNLSSRFEAQRYGDTFLTLTTRLPIRSARIMTASDTVPHAGVPFSAGGTTCLNVPHDTVHVELQVSSR